MPEQMPERQPTGQMPEQMPQTPGQKLRKPQPLKEQQLAKR